MSETLKIGRIDWNYLDTKKGDGLWIGFHGYGQGAQIMHHFLCHLRPHDRIVSFDLPYHGKTMVDKQSLTTADLMELVDPLMRDHGVQQCTLVGFSLGGKIVLKLVESIPGKIERVILIAPDGLRTNPIYWFATNTWIGRGFFKLMIRIPGPFLGASAMLAGLKLMHHRIHEFVSNQMATREKRQRVFDVWQMFKRISPQLKEVRKKIHLYRIKPTLVFGKYDKVINPELAAKLSGTNCKTAKVILLDTGHDLLTRETAEQLRDRIE